MHFTKTFLLDMLEATPGDDCLVYDKIIGHGRWSVHHEQVFKHNGKFYRTTYSVGATESQDERPYEYEPQDIWCDEVFPKEKTIVEYLTATEIEKNRAAVD